MGEQHRVAAQHVDAGGDHRRRVDQRRDRRRPFHRVRQPDEQRNLRALPGRADEQEQTDHRQHAEMRGLDRHRGGGVLNRAEVEGPERRVDQEHAEHEAPVADAVGDERLLAGVRRALLLVPVADQQIRAQADPFPADEHHQEVVAQDQHQHEEAEQVEIAEEARHAGPRLVGDVGGRVDVDQRADAGDDQQHHPRQRIEPESPRHLQAADAAVAQLERDRRDPLGDRDVERPRLGRQREQLPEGDHRQPERRDHRHARHQAGGPARERTDPDQTVDRRPEPGEKRDEPDIFHVV